jgi:PAS domain S-box-containing protein
VSHQSVLNHRALEVLDLLPAGVYAVDATGLIQFCNRQAVELWGHAPDPRDPAYRYCGAHRLFAPDGTHIPHEECPLVDVLRDGRPQHVTHAIMERRDGGRIHVQASISPLHDPAGNVVGAINCFQRVDDRVAVEQELRRQLDVTRAITDHAADALFLCDARGFVTFANPAAVRTFGFSVEELRSAPLHDLIHARHPDGRPYPKSDCPLGRVYTHGETVRGHEDTFYRRDGRAVPVVCSNAPILLHGRVVAAVLVVHDTTDLRRAESDIRHRAASLKLLSDTATRLLMSDRPGELLPSILDAICKHLGCSHYLNYLVADGDGPTAGKHLRLNAYGGIDPATARAIGRLEFGQALCGTAAELGTRVVSEDVQHNGDPRAALVRSLGCTAYCCHPLIANGRTIGTFSFAASDRVRFGPEDLDLLRTASDQIAMALERSRLGEELVRRNAELTEANAAKDQFLAALSHELRTPLTPVLMAAGAMEADPRLPAEMRGDLAMIRHNVQLEARLIDDLLDLTKITRNKLDLHTEVVDAHDLIRQTIGTCCGPELRAKRLTLTLDLLAVRPTVRADPARLQQVLWNLLKNAIKFTPAGGAITVRTRNGSGTGDGLGSLVVEVEDTGIGIPPGVLPHIFDAFSQGDPAITRRFGGLGLGLAITKALVDLHGGRSRPGPTARMPARRSP